MREPTTIPAAALAQLAEDPDVQAASKALLIATLQYQAQVMRFGNPASKALLAKTYAPIIAAVLRAAPNRGNDALRDEFRDMMGELRGATPEATIEAPAVARPDVPRGT
jgi:hypothetical protein